MPPDALTPSCRPDGLAQQADVGDGRAAGRVESGRRLDEGRAGVAREAARERLLGVGQRRRLEDHLDRHAGDGANDRLDVGGDDGRVAAPQRAEVHHHVDLGRAVGDGERRGARLHLGPVAAVRKARDRDDASVHAGERGDSHAHPARLHAVEADPPRVDHVGACANVGFGRLGLQHRMVEDAGERAAVHGAFLAASARARSMRAPSERASSSGRATSGVVSGTPRK